MAPRLPSADDLGPAGSLSSQRGLATYDLSPLARGQAAVAGGLEKIGDTGVRIGLDMMAKEKREGASSTRPAWTPPSSRRTPTSS